MSESENAVLEKVRAIIAEVTGVDRSRVTMDSDLCRDLGVAGDDGHDLFKAFDEAFDVDWTGLDLGVHFGNEPPGWVPFPWHLKNNCVLYVSQPCKVSDVVQAVQVGRWHGTELVLRSKYRRGLLYAFSVLQALFLGAMILAILAGVVLSLLE